MYYKEDIYIPDTGKFIERSVMYFGNIPYIKYNGKYYLVESIVHNIPEELRKQGINKLAYGTYKIVRELSVNMF